VLLVVGTQPSDDVWKAAISIGAERVLSISEHDDELVAALSDAGESSASIAGRGDVVAVIGGRGGSGASIFSAALAITAVDPLLIDVDPWGGGIDMLLGGEGQPGLRWPDLSLQCGRLNYAALREALPNHRGICVLSATRRGAQIGAGPLQAVIDAGRRGGVTVVCDLPRRLTAAAEAALDEADLVVVVGQCDVRCCAAIAAMASTLTTVNPNVGLVVRGPSPGGLRAAEAAQATGLPLLTAMRAEPGLAARIERGGLHLPRRSALAAAARRVLAVLDHHSAVAP
jgi:secretion/DNA translocation related CpaE-like protein